jgi:hypothetical protein
MPVWTAIEHNRSPLVRALHAWWLAHRRDSGLPDRSDVDPVALKALLPNLFIAEVEHVPFRIRYRLVGTKAVQVIGFDITGRYLDEMLRVDAEVPWLDYYRIVYDSRDPLMGSVVVPARSGGTLTYEFGLFPVTQGGSRVEQFVSIEDYFDVDLTAAQLVARGSGTGSSGQLR